MSNLPVKVVVFNCDKCGKQQTLVAYHNNYGWYCRDCVNVIYTRMGKVLEAIDETATQCNKTIGIDPRTTNNNDDN